MLDTIISTFRKLAMQHKLLRSFYYDKNYEMGEGNEYHPMLWLEEPLYGSNNGKEGEGFYITVTFCILLVPNTDMDVERCQSLALSCGLNILEKIKHNEDSEFTVRNDWTWLTLSDYYDNNCSGVRITANLYMKNISNYCVLDEQFDVTKEFENKEVITDFDVNAKSKCEVFTEKSLNFDLKLKR